jgi:glucokinase
MSGRYRSRAVRPDRAIGIDLGGTKILAGVVGRDGSVEGSVEVATPSGSATAVLATMDGLVEELGGGGAAAALGLGVPFNLDRRSGVGLRATNLPLRGVDFLDWAARHHLPAGVENDGNAAALAEWRVGSARGAEDVVALTLGTGVGGGLVLGGRLYRGWAELGHVVVDADGPPCQGTCHGRGHLEGMASGLAADRAARDLYGDEADAHMLVARAREGDAAAAGALARIGHLLGVAIGSLVNIFDPDVVVVGGGFGAAAGDLVLEPARAAARREAIEPADERLRIVTAELGEEAGLIGAALVGFEALDGLR